MTASSAYDTTANGIRLWQSEEDISEETTLREFAAKLDRGEEAVNRIGPAITAHVTLWLDTTHEGFHVSQILPEGYEVADTFVSEVGVSVQVVKE